MSWVPEFLLEDPGVACVSGILIGRPGLVCCDTPDGKSRLPITLSSSRFPILLLDQEEYRTPRLEIAARFVMPPGADDPLKASMLCSLQKKSWDPGLWLPWGRSELLV